MNEAQQEILEHALGYGVSPKQKRPYRNRYNAPSTCDAYGNCIALVDQGMMTAGAESGWFYVSAAGIRHVFQGKGIVVPDADIEHFILTGDWPN